MMVTNVQIFLSKLTSHDKHHAHFKYQNINNMNRMKPTASIYLLWATTYSSITVWLNYLYAL